MELAGIAAGGNMRSMLSDFDIKNAAELEAHINMNAIAARANFDKYYRERLTDVSKLWRDVRRRLDVREPLEVPVFVLDVGTSKFDYTRRSAHCSMKSWWSEKLAKWTEKLRKQMATRL